MERGKGLKMERGWTRRGFKDVPGDVIVEDKRRVGQWDTPIDENGCGNVSYSP